MAATTNIPLRRSLFVAVVMLLIWPWLVVANPVNSVADPANAQTHCAGPVLDFSEAVSNAVSAQGVDEHLRRLFLRNLEQCRAVYHYQLQRLAEEFDDLPANAYCHSVRLEFIEAADLFDIAAMRARQLPLDTDEERNRAAEFFQQANRALVRAVNGLFLLRHGICMEERIAPFDWPPLEGEMNRTYPHIE